MWLATDDDLVQMYECRQSYKEILLCCLGEAQDQSNVPVQSQNSSGKQKSRKRASPEDEGSKPSKSKRDTCANKVTEVEGIVKQLQDKHGSAYSVEKLNAWAHMMHVQKHASYDTPPDFPFFKKCRTSQQSTQDGEPQNSGSIPSPSKRLSQRSECIKQLQQWHDLFDKGAIFQQQYDDLQKTIMEDIFRKN